jgi:hypothetical protein
MTKRRTTRLVYGLLTTVLLMGGTAVIAGSFSPTLPKAKEYADPVNKCVEPVEDMRRNHMSYILHQRDATVHAGIRTSRHSLAKCISCHVQKDDSGQFVPINSKGQFCQICHEFAAVEIDCFECHATVPN